MRKWKVKCHGIFDDLWKSRQENERQRYRQKYYEKLAEEMNIPKSSCHFGYFDLAMLKQAHEILVSGKLNEGSET